MRTFEINRLRDGLSVWVKYALLWLLLTFILRMGFFFVMNVSGLVQSSSFLTILSGVYFDLAVVLEISAIALVPVLIINYFSPKTTKALAVAFITLYVVAYGGLIGYYSNVNLPLDRVFFVYGVGEMYNIVVSSVSFSILPLLGVIVLVALYSFLIRFWNKRVKISNALSMGFLVVTMVFVIFFDFKALITRDKGYKSYQDYCLAANQLAYTLNDFNEYRIEQAEAEDYSIFNSVSLSPLSLR